MIKTVTILLCLFNLRMVFKILTNQNIVTTIWDVIIFT